MINYRKEKYHDDLLIQLVKDLDGCNRLDLLGKALDIQIPDEKLERAKNRGPFDVEITLQNLSIVVESKVDSDESGRWDGEWQTDRIVEKSESLNYLEPRKQFRYITYGTSEYYTKPYEEGPHSPEFKHIGLNRMIDLVADSEKVLEPCEERRQWLRSMKIEKEKRRQAIPLLRSFSKFRKEYLAIGGDNDFPRKELLFCAPEIAFPALSLLKQAWHESAYVERYGKLSLYPVGRFSPSIPDSILNFWEMWDSNEHVLGRTSIGMGEPDIYLEINEDFNLNLKCGGIIHDQKKQKAQKKQKVWKRLQRARLPPGCRGQCRDYEQTVVVLYEFDFGFLDHLDDMPKAVSNLGETVSAIVKALP